MDRKDFLLLVVAAGKESPLTPVQLQKSLFLIGQAGLPETRKPYYEFEPYDYGPFDSDIYVDADGLHTQGLVARLPSARGSWIDTAITAGGLEKAAEVKKTLSPQVAKYIEDVVQWVQSQSFAGLLRAIYARHPEFSVNSVFQG